MNKDSRIIVTGAAGLVGRELVAKLKGDGYSRVSALTRNECDLEDCKQVCATFSEIKPEFVFHVAAKVGGIQFNVDHPVEVLSSNLLSQVSVLQASHSAGVKKILLMGSSCIYPRDCAQPMREEYLFQGPLEPTNEGYAISKIAGLRLAQYYNRQYGLKVALPMPCNIYGPGDSFDLARCNVLSALVKRFCDAARLNLSSISLWGTGKAKREFVYTSDVVDSMLFLMEKSEDSRIYNVGTGSDISIRDLANLIAEKVGYSGAIHWDETKPDGMLRKCVDISRLAALGFQAKVELGVGIDRVIADYRRNGVVKP